VRHSRLFRTFYFASVYLLVCIIIALIVIQIPVKNQLEQLRIENEKIFESYGEITQSTYWWENSDLWWYKARAKLSSCPEFYTLNTLQSSFRLSCLPQSIPQIQKFPDIKLLWIDATFADDSVDFVVAREYFSDQWAKLYLTQSPGRFPGSGVLRTSSKFIFNNKKTLYIFYNERKKIEKYKRDQVIHEIKKQFPHLDDVRVHSFFYYKKVLWEDPFDSDLGRVMYYIGDCELREHTFCNNQLVEDGKYQSFTNTLIDQDLDFFFIVPALQEILQVQNISSWTPGRFLQWLFKSSD